MSASQLAGSLGTGLNFGTVRVWQNCTNLLNITQLLFEFGILYCRNKQMLSTEIKHFCTTRCMTDIESQMLIVINERSTNDETLSVLAAVSKKNTSAKPN